MERFAAGRLDVRLWCLADDAFGQCCHNADHVLAIVEHEEDLPVANKGQHICMTKKATLNELGKMLEHVVKHMATKEDIADLRIELKGDIASAHTQVNSIERQLRETKIEIRLGNLEEKVFGQARR